MTIDGSKRFRRRQREGRRYAEGDVSRTSLADLEWAAVERRCPWCTEGPFENPSGHWFMAHGARARDIKLRLQVPLDTPLVAPEVSAKIRAANANQHFDPEWLAEMGKLGAKRALELPKTPLQMAQREDATAAMRQGSALARHLGLPSPTEDA